MGNNPSNWRACLDWLIGERGMLKVLEGGFGRFVPQSGGSPNYSRGRTAEGVALQRKYTNAEGKVDVCGLMRELDALEAAGLA
jgi:hypothetical protein